MSYEIVLKRATYPKRVTLLDLEDNPFSIHDCTISSTSYNLYDSATAHNEIEVQALVTLSDYDFLG